ncbi:MAG: putative sulfate exporter family transporter [Deltaproteobacteria bacterium]|nr:putative sulfate exporter family transporter [Deltaproteobacteria bacterium]
MSRPADLPRLAPGLGAALGLALVAAPLASWLSASLLRLGGLPAGASPLSAIPVAVLLGLLVINTLGGALPKLSLVLAPGLEWATKYALRLGVILIGLKLNALDVLRVGALGVPVVVTLVLLGLVSARLLARWIGVSERLGLLAAASTAICGVTATLAVAPGIEADEREVAYTVANVTLFGLLGMVFYPALAHALFAGNPGAAGLFLGAAIHDTSQVMGAAIAYREVYGDERVLQIATVIKLTRNALLVLVVPGLTWLYQRGRAQAPGAKSPSLLSLFPTFVLGFLLLSVVRTVGDWGLSQGGLAWGVTSAEGWRGFTKLLGEQAATLALSTALAGVGLSTRLGTLSGLGLRPLAVGFGAALTVGLGALGLAAWIGAGLG